MSQRLFDFQGNDDEYIRFLESRLISVQPFLGYPDPISALPLERSHNGSASTGSFRFVECTPQLAGHAQLLAPNKETVKWKKQLENFVHAIPLSEAQWNEAKKKAGIDGPLKNQQALKLILGHAGPAIFHENHDDIVVPSFLHTSCRQLITRGCQYGSFISRCADDRNFAVRVVAFQNLIFCSYCAVMMRAGIPKAMTNDTMRRYTGHDQDDQTLEKYRLGALWVNRCAAALLANGWGHKSWEVFLLENRTPAQFARFAAYDATSYQVVVSHLGEAAIPLCERGWISYCIPSIVYYLMGGTLQLADICEILGYGPLRSSPVWPISTHFTTSLDDLFGGYVAQPVPIMQSLTLPNSHEQAPSGSKPTGPLPAEFPRPDNLL